jgi:hypothetical protein
VAIGKYISATGVNDGEKKKKGEVQVTISKHSDIDTTVAGSGSPNHTLAAGIAPDSGTPVNADRLSLG